ncbi:MAG: alpha-amylase family glycosyl hydrolase [Chloroflexota bacterium]|nr:alpha-amylase family glycosyl hydrolase [Chloroflexota bacterium]
MFKTTSPRDHALREFHVSRQARNHYQFNDSLFSLNGNVLFANFHAARLFAQKMNAQRDLLLHPEQAVRASDINALGLIDEFSHHVVARYREERNPTVLKDALAHLNTELGAETVATALAAFADEFPPVAVYRGELPLADYLAGETDGTPHQQVVLEELLLLWLANNNPAFAPFRELFDDHQLSQQTVYPELMTSLRNFFAKEPGFGAGDENLINLLRAPALNSPGSLTGQLEYIRSHWGVFLGQYLVRLLSSLDFLSEENKAFFGLGPGPAEVYEFGEQAAALENFSPDSDWMPQLVMLAKNVYVWLDQLSKEFGHTIHQLDQVPDKALARLARRGFTGLWLIGLWERSKASQRIKQIMGNPEAVASAYSLYDYIIAADLGGEAAFQHLKERAWKYGLRMASDMVPNHTGIDSRLMIEHPDWFVHLDYSPFPTYTFNGEDLCADDRVGVYLEDHYYEHSDAAVVFKRVDHWTGDTRYIYHGNDGTSMPWNDTAQLNYLLPAVREAVIQTILDVARRSPIIRFDAAMTLAKQHYQRLWFPEPGSGGDIATRADFGMTKSAFDQVFPVEFWREVVDRVAVETPNTLLLAEAFWMMEGYFVRTLGMHRVYNSAFMNMLRDEKNNEYRQLIKNTLEFDPQILKRYVNFMNNPDERTAIDQFGEGDKYFGICTLMSTLPGLPMFGHGQVEGYAEKYGMEYRRAYWDETPHPQLVERHKREVFPLLHKRYLFAEVANFLLYDFYTPEGRVDENVFAYSNEAYGERSLVLYHNRYATTSGWLQTSAAYAIKGPNDEKALVQKTLTSGLNIPNTADTYLLFHDAVSGLEYIRSCRELHEHGFYAQLQAYQVHVFLDFQVVHDNESRQYARLNHTLNGKGVPNIREALQELLLEPVHAPLRMLISAPAFKWLLQARQTETSADYQQVSAQVGQKLLDLLQAIKATEADEARAEKMQAIVEEVCAKLKALLTLPTYWPEDSSAMSAADEKLRDYLLTALADEDPAVWGTLLGWLFTHDLGKMVEEEAYAAISRSWLADWLLDKVIARALRELGVAEEPTRHALDTIELFIGYRRWLGEAESLGAVAPYTLLQTALREPAVQAYLGINRFEDTLWFNKEAFEQFLWHLMLLETLELRAGDAPETASADIAAGYAVIAQLRAAAEQSEYQLAKLLAAVQ